MTFDLPTLRVTSALIIGFVGLLMMVLNRGTPDGASGDTPLGLWAAALLVGVVGLLVGSLIPAPADRLLSNALLLLASALSWTAARIFGGRAPILFAMVGGPVAWLTLAVALPALDWPAVINGAGAAYTALALLELWRCRPERLPALPLAMAMLATHAAIYLIRAGQGLQHAPTWPGTEIALLLEGTLHAVGMGFVLLALTAERTSARATAGLRRQALVDGLTGVSNRRQLDTHLASEVRRASRNGTSLAVLLIDADHFKRFNDRYGHLEGDTCLRRLASCLSGFVRRPGDLVARFGGEEFVMVLPNTSPAGAVELAEGVREAVALMGIRHEDNSHGRVTVSVGIATTVPPPGTDSGEALMRSADKALYLAKESGRNTVRIAPEAAGAALAPVAPAIPDRAAVPG